MPKIQTNTQCALVRLSDDTVGVFFADAADYFETTPPTTIEKLVTPDGAKILGIEIFPQSDNNLLNHLNVYYDDSECAAPWELAIGKLNQRTFLNTGYHKRSALRDYKTAVMVLDSPVAISPGIVTLLLA
jgi:hypothetical protein